MRIARLISIITIFVAIAFQSKAQILPIDSVSNKAKIRTVVIAKSAFYAGTMTYLYSQWYSEYTSSKFHFFNDNAEWLQMDKVGHTGTAYYLNKVSFDLFRYAGLNSKKAMWFGSGFSLIYLSTVEVLDGFSDKWGASYGDILANVAGTSLFVAQQSIWDEQRLFLKYSYSKSRYAKYRPNVLGGVFYESMLKDYNGQTYWLSANIASFLKDSNIPKFLNIAVGYSADGMLGGFSNPSEINGNPIPHYDRKRQYFLSLDIDFTRIPTNSKFLKGLFEVFSFVKFPFPALEFSNTGVEYHWMYF